jgi:hypothetical protein
VTSSQNNPHDGGVNWMLTNKENSDLTQAEKLEVLESKMLDLPQVDCPVVHHFGPGIYIREVHFPANTFAIGHAQKYEQLNIMLKGKVAVAENGQLKILEAPLIFVGPPGRKSGYIIEDTIWQNVYATDETDVDKLEAMFLDKSDTWINDDAAQTEIRYAMHVDDRHDYEYFLNQIGITDELVREQSEDESDQVPMPAGFSNVTVRNSFIEGKGIFLSSPVEPGEVIAPARIKDKRTPAGRFTNHSNNPNAYFEMNDAGDIYLFASRPIKGCVGGEQGEEITVNYRQALALSGIYVEDIKS